MQQATATGAALLSGRAPRMPPTQGLRVPHSMHGRCALRAPLLFGGREAHVARSTSPKGRSRFWEEGAAQEYDHEPPEAYKNWQNVDFGTIIATEARMKFIQEVEGSGEAYMDLASMAMQVRAPQSLLLPAPSPHISSRSLWCPGHRLPAGRC